MSKLFVAARRMSCQCDHEPPKLNPDEWWGPNELKGKQDTSVKPFQVKFSEEMIKDLKYRLKNHRPFTPPLEDVGFEYGFNSAQLDTWINYWADKYPFADRENFFNQFPQFKTNIQGLNIHFIRVKPQVPSNVQVVPLLLMHGWPGSVREFYEAIPLLTKQTPGYNFVFEVIVPSLPGCGFSDATVRPGLGSPQVGVVMRNLMHRLGFKKYYIQGGDAGAFIASAMVTIFPDEILGHHTNTALILTPSSMLKTFIGAFIPSLVVEPHLADRMYPLSSFFAFLMEEFGYFHLQATKPDTVGHYVADDLKDEVDIERERRALAVRCNMLARSVGLTDSPSGLLAYILEKFSTWTVREHKTLEDGGLTTSGKFSKDQLIDNLMLYWATNSITTSMRYYADTLSSKVLAMSLKLYKVKTPVPTWALQAKDELIYQPPGILKKKYTNLIGVTVLDEGGHFIAFELPQIFVGDVFKAVKAFKDWHAQN